MIRRLASLTFIVTAVACSSDGATAPDRPVTAVAVTPTLSAMIISQSVQLAAAVTGGFGKPTVTWATSNASIVSVGDSGLVTAKAVGTATVTATAGGIIGSSNITVTAGVVDRVSVCDRANTSGCAASATLGSLGTSAAVRASAYNVLGAEITSSCVFTWTPNAQNVVSITFFGDATKRDALITRTGYGITSVIVSCGGLPSVFTVAGPTAPPATP